MEKAIIQINGGQISVIEKKTPHPLSLSKVQEYLHSYYKQRGGRDETKDIMLFINANRGHSTVKTLKNQEFLLLYKEHLLYHPYVITTLIVTTLIVATLIVATLKPKTLN